MVQFYHFCITLLHDFKTGKSLSDSLRLIITFVEASIETSIASVPIIKKKIQSCFQLLGKLPNPEKIDKGRYLLK